MKTRWIIKLSFLALLTSSCVTKFMPEISDKEDLLVVEGLITDQPGICKINISKSQPLWTNRIPVPVRRCKVWISDDMGKVDTLREQLSGSYFTDSATFQGVVGRNYVLHFITGPEDGGLNYESFPMEMKPVPPIDRIYYEKQIFIYDHQPYEGCKIFVDTHDSTEQCNSYRWTWSETWEFHIPYKVTFRQCWLTNNSDLILVKNSASQGEATITRFPVNLIVNPVDRLNIKYSILVNQYSMNDDEYLYWERLKNMSEEVGGLYDFIPVSIPNNIYCIENPYEKVLGYFSVSAVTSKRIFINDKFEGVNNLYFGCPTDTVYGDEIIPGLDSLVWIIGESPEEDPPVKILTDKRGCADCRVRGTDTKPSFWK